MLSAGFPDRFQLWGPILAIFALLAALLVTPTWPTWFWYHPAAMLVGYVGLMGNAVLVKKIGGASTTYITIYIYIIDVSYIID